MSRLLACMVEMRNAYKILIRRSEGKRPLRRPRHRSDDNIILNLRETGWEGMDRIQLAQDRDQCWALVYMLMNLRDL
jgi:hypothetical protein